MRDASFYNLQVLEIDLSRKTSLWLVINDGHMGIEGNPAPAVVPGTISNLANVNTIPWGSREDVIGPAKHWERLVF
jgi:hypothetical protein